MARRKKKEKKELSDEETDELVSDWMLSIDDLKEFFFEHSVEDESDEYYDNFLEKFQIVVKLFDLMIEHKMIVTGPQVESEENLHIKKVKGQREDN